MSFGAVHLAFHPCSKLQGITAKANKRQTALTAGFVGYLDGNNILDMYA
jgi:hypothetical protein